MLQDLIDALKGYLTTFFERLSVKELEHILPQLGACQGTIFFTGVGKSGLIAQKVAATHLSCGTKSAYLSCSDALHGDIGAVQTGDIVILFSKSGESEELIRLVHHIKARGAKSISVVCSPNSRLAKVADEQVFLPLERELCPFDLAPTTSTIQQLIFGDLLAVALMHYKRFSVDQYAKNHPAGQIGLRATLTVGDLMIDEIPSCRASDRLQDVLGELSKKRCGCILILDEESRLEGIFTDGDLRRSLQSYQGDVLATPLSKLMSKNPKSIDRHELAFNALKKMEEDKSRPVNVLPVLSDQKVVGLLRLHDLIQAGL